MCIGGICMYFFGIEIATVFTGDPTDPTTISVASLLKIVAYALPSLAIVMVLTGGFRGAGDTFWPFIFTAVGFFIINFFMPANENAMQCVVRCLYCTSSCWRRFTHFSKAPFKNSVRQAKCQRQYYSGL